MFRHRPIILIIDDDPLILEWLFKLLEDLAEVFIVNTGEQGLAMALQLRPNLIICDLVMPELDGILVCERLQSDPVTRSIPVLCMSVLTDPHDEVAAFTAGAADFIRKPLVPVVVRARVRHLLQWQLEAATLREKVNVDGLTGICNRRYFEERFEEEWNRQRRNRDWLTVAMVDIDKFKDFNDHFGHVKGDDCLIHVADCLSKLSRRPADLVARYGGEEFVYILPHLNREQGGAFGEVVCKAIRSLHHPHAPSLCKNLTVSVGVASTIPADPDTCHALLARADEALYRAKEGGRDRHCVHSDTKEAPATKPERSLPETKSNI